MVCAIYCNSVSFIVRARFGKFVDASADIDHQCRRANKEPLLIETIFCGLCCIILKLGELYCICYIYVGYIIILSVTGCLG